MSLAAGATDMVLAAVAWAAAASTARRTPVGDVWGVGFAAVALAATFGSLRFLVSESVAPVHDGLTRGAAAFGVPMLALGAVAVGAGRARAWLAPAAVAVVVGGIVAWGSPQGSEVWGAASVLAGAIGALAALARDRAAGAALLAGWGGVALAGWAVPADQVAVFHLALAAALLALAFGASRSLR